MIILMSIYAYKNCIKEFVYVAIVNYYISKYHV
jgi:hypothetical protein